MLPRLDIIDPITHPQWDALVQNGQTCSFFHSSYWARVLQETYGYRPLYFTVIKDGMLSLLVPMMEVNSVFTGKRGVSLPFSDYCEINIEQQIDFSDVMAAIVDYGKRARWKTVEFMDGRYFDSDIAPYSEFYGHVINIDKDPEILFHAFSNNTKRNIRKALQREILVTKDDSLDAVREFYRLHCLTRRRHGIPPQPYKFFENVHERVIRGRYGFIMQASYHGRTIASSMFFNCGDQAIYKYGASDQSYTYLPANSLVMWQAIKWLSGNGFKQLSFGRTELENEGLRRFKKGWGAAERKIKYCKYDLHTGKFISKNSHISDLQRKISSKLPLFVLRTAGALIYKHIG